ncbi:hypothetical protein DXG01_005595 [Tephrocybe rancida]|nr:hypothetical protein DXG01_005595 [Tephrocybe rancida]
MRGRVIELATNCYGCHVLQKALDYEDIRLLIVSELLLGDPAQTLVNKHASYIWNKVLLRAFLLAFPSFFDDFIVEVYDWMLSSRFLFEDDLMLMWSLGRLWSSHGRRRSLLSACRFSPTFLSNGTVLTMEDSVNKSLKGKWASLACHETGSLVIQHAFENLEAEAKDGIVDELINSGPVVFAEVVKNQWGSYCVQHILEHGSEAHRAQTLQHLLDGLLDFATNEQGAKSVTKALKEGEKATLDRIVGRMCEADNGSRRAMIVNLA